jgi:hypothetical protein
MRDAGVDEKAIEARLATNFEANASPLQKKAAEYGKKLADQGHTEDYVREKMFAYIANVQRLEALEADD